MKLLKKAAAIVTALAVWTTSLAGLELTSITAGASTVHIWDGTIDTSWFTNDSDTYEIYTPEQLAGLSYLADDPDHRGGHGDRFRGVTINLMNDIVLNDTTNWQDWVNTPPKNEWEPIGEKGDPAIKGYCPFAGVFNGNGHTVSGIYCNSKQYINGCTRIGLFDYLSGAVVCNLKIEKSVLLGGTDAGAGALAAHAEYSYIDSVEVSDVIINQKGDTGAIVGTCYYQYKYTTFVAYMLVASTGILMNPLLFLSQDSDSDYYEDPVKKYNGTIFANCKVSNVQITSNEGLKWYTPSRSTHVGTIAGWMPGGGVFNCISENCTITFDPKRQNQGKLSGGAMYGGKGDNDVVTVQNCYTYNFKMLNGKSQQDADLVSALSKDEYLSQNLLNKLGKGFISVPNATPIVTALKEATLNETIIPGDFDNNGKLTIMDVSNVLKAFANDDALDYRTFMASDMNGNGKLDITDVSMVLKKFANG